jgi:hypothetical protein
MPKSVLRPKNKRFGKFYSGILDGYLKKSWPAPESFPVRTFLCSVPKKSTKRKAALRLVPTSVGTRNAGVPFLDGTPSLGTQRRGAKKVSKNSYFVHYPRVCARQALQFFSPAEAQGRRGSLLKIHSLPATCCRIPRKKLIYLFEGCPAALPLFLHPCAEFVRHLSREISRHILPIPYFFLFIANI